MSRAAPVTLGVLAGEASGDNLGVGLMRALRARAGPGREIRFVGVGGSRMCAEGLEALAPMESLAVNGFRDPIVRLPELFRLLRTIRGEMIERDVDAFIGIDFNVFNLLLERSLKKCGIPTVHYVSPSVYAWRTGRTRRISRSADLLLCLYPFEPDLYAGTPVQAKYVGHPLADEIDLDETRPAAVAAAREALGIEASALVLAVLPGSRRGEVQLMLDDFLKAAELFAAQQERPVSVVIPCPREALEEVLQQTLERFENLGVVVDRGNARRALTAADVALVKAGTSTLEAMLLHCPMVVSYRLGTLSAFFARRVVRTPYVALPNILAGEMLVPELLQEAGTPEALATALQHELTAQHERTRKFHVLHEVLRQDADANAADAVLHLLDA